MSTEDVEAIRQRIASLLADSAIIKRISDRIDRAARKSLPADVAAGKRVAPLLDDCATGRRTADRIDQAVRELFHLLPEPLRPTGTPRPRKPREPLSEGPDGRENHGPKPGGPIPPEVRWPDWTIELILELADAFFAKYGKWPTSSSGRISSESPDTWNGIDLALKRGNRNLPGGTTLARLLAEHRGVRNRTSLPPLDLETIHVWLDYHKAVKGAWPTALSGPVMGAPGETWLAIDHALKRGSRGLKTRTSLARLIAEWCGVPMRLDQPPLTEAQIVAWADAYFARTGRWPTRDSGVIPEAPNETWKRINNALIQGNRSLPGGSSLARLLAEHRGVRNRKALPHFNIKTILLWEDRHYERHGRWATVWSGPIEDAPGETWSAVDAAFKQGTRGLAGCGYRSLTHLLDERRGKLQRRGNRPAERILPVVE